MLERLGCGEATVGELALPLGMSAPAVTKHIRVLAKAHLITQGRNSRWRPCRLEEAPLRTAADWLEEQRTTWEARLDRLGPTCALWRNPGRETAMAMAENDREVVLQRQVPFARELVWKAITDLAHMRQWWGPDGFTIEKLSLDLRVGGAWTFDMIGPDGVRYPNHSVFTEVAPPSRLVFDHGDGQRVWFIASIILDATDAGTGTLVTLRHLFPSREERDLVVEKYGAIEGGKQHLAKLEAYVQENLA
jgi:uncharacterized protein YndB with AHSA1/START domain